MRRNANLVVRRLDFGVVPSALNSTTKLALGVSKR